MKKKKDKIIVGTEVLLLCMILGILRINAASSNPSSSEVNYNKNSQTNVQDSINDLYNKVNYGDAKANEILNGKKALVGGKEIIGTYTCTVSASQTPGDAKPEDITEGKIAWVNGRKIVGTRTSLADKVQLGDYISYTPIKKNYVVPSSKSGYKFDQGISISGSRWLVLNKTPEGTVEIVLTAVGNALRFGGESDIAKKTAYKNYVGVLNSIAEQYENPEYTVSSRSIGYDRLRVKEYLTDDEIDNGLDSGHLKDEDLLYKALGHLDYDLIGGFYWLASRASRFEVHYMGNVGVGLRYKVLRTSLMGSDCIAQNIQEGCRDGRPVSIVELKSTLKITGGNGTKDSPYTLGV